MKKYMAILPWISSSDDAFGCWAPIFIPTSLVKVHQLVAGVEDYEN